MYTIYHEDKTQQLFTNESIKGHLVQNQKMTPTEASIVIGDSRLESRPIKLPEGILLYWTKKLGENTYQGLLTQIQEREESLKPKTLVSHAKKPKSLASFKPISDISKDKPQKKKSPGPALNPGQFSASDLAEELGIEPKKLRKLLRAHGVQKNGASYSWSSKEEALKSIGK